MSLSAPIERPDLSPIEHAAWRDLIAARCGIDFAENRSKNLARGLWGRAVEVGARSYGEYQRYLSKSGGDGEWQALLERLVNGETRFWRHQPSFEGLMDHHLPRLVSERRYRAGSEGSVVRLWSAGCSTGEEAYSLAIASRVALEGTGLRTEVFACDLSDVALVRARRATYPVRSVASLPTALRRRFLTLIEGAESGASHGGAGRQGFEVRYAVREEVRRFVRFERANLAEIETEAMAPPGLQDAIFCQNVLIYFRPERRVEVVRRLASHLAPQGVLFLAPGEVIGLSVPELTAERVPGAAMYRRA